MAELESNAPRADMEKNIQLPEWEHTAAAGVPAEKTHKSPMAGMSRRFDTIMPPNRRYLKLKRRTFLLVLLGALLALLALIIGLAVGLTEGSRYHPHSPPRADLVENTKRWNPSGGHYTPLPPNGQVHDGQLTYYEPGLGACGIDSNSQEDIVAISHYIFDAASTSSNPNSNPLCGRMLRASRFDTQYNQQRSVDLKVVDRCVGCEAYDLDTSLSAFDQLAQQWMGRVDVEWEWL